MLHDIARPVCVFAQCVGLALGVAVVLDGARAQSVEPPNWVDSLRKLAASEDPATRGEAALGLGMLGDPNDQALIASIARQRQPEAAVPATVGLGYLATPGVEIVIDEQFDKRGERNEARRVAAAFALGLLPDSHSTPTLDEFLGGIPGGSYQNQHDEIAAWLGGVLHARSPARRTMVRFIVEDDANKELDLRELALCALARFDDLLSPKDLQDLRESKHPALRRAGLEGIARGALSDDALRGEVVRIARRDPAVQVRVAALDLLTRERVFAALERGGDAVESDEPSEAAAGVRAVLAFGGHALRRALERKVLATELPHARRLQMLRAWSGKPSNDFTLGLLQIASDSRTPFDLSCVAATVAARSGDARAGTLLRRALRRAERIDDIETLMRGLQELGDTDTLTAIDELDSAGYAARLAALFRFDPTTALTHLRQAVAADRLTPAERLDCMRAWRRSYSVDVEGRLLRMLPAGLTGL